MAVQFNFQASSMPLQNVHAFSSLVVDYINHNKVFREFVNYMPNWMGIDQAIKDRSAFPVNRELLVEVLKQQYQQAGFHHKEDEQCLANIDLLLQETTFTVTTAHQPNLLTGYLYFFYKILHAIKLCEDLKAEYPNLNFVPVYYMGSEDNDLEELGTFFYDNQQYIWDGAGQKGAVGRMSTDGLKPVIDDLFRVLGPPSEFTTEIKNLIEASYLQGKTIAEATFFFVHHLMRHYGLIVLQPDVVALKKSFIPVIKKDVLEQQSLPVVQSTMAKLSEHYTTQAFPRPINFFYLKDNLRERITCDDGKTWSVLNTDITFSQEEMDREIDNHPERFSPNVILRAVYQETILPNVVFIGGGAEVNYWLQFKDLLNHYGVFYPLIILRQSVQLVTPKAQQLLDQLNLDLETVFLPKLSMELDFVNQHAEQQFDTESFQQQIHGIVADLKNHLQHIDSTLSASAGVFEQKVLHLMHNLDKKIIRAEKRKHQQIFDRVDALRSMIKPLNHLQERQENFLQYYPYYGLFLLDFIKNKTKTFGENFLIVNLDPLINFFQHHETK